MASHPYSVRFLEATGNSVAKAMTVPAGKRAVIRGINYSCVASQSSQIWVGAHGMYVWYVAIPAPTDGGFKELRAVAYAGELIQLVTSGTDVRAHLSGFLFDDPFGPALQVQQLPAEQIPLPYPEWPDPIPPWPAGQQPS